MHFTVTLSLDKTTKNTVVYKAPKGTAIDTLYIQQSALMGPDGAFPKTITVEVK